MPAATPPMTHDLSTALQDAESDLDIEEGWAAKGRGLAMVDHGTVK